MSCQMMMSLGVYVLGAAEAGERARVEAHLPDCPVCQAELMRLAPLPGLLADVPSGLRPEGKQLGEAAGQAPGRTRARPDRRWRGAAVAACPAPVAGAGRGVWAGPSGAGPPPAPRPPSAPGAGARACARAARPPT